MPIKDILNVQRRFLRSTQIERDFADPTCLNGYVVTPHVRESISRINTGLAANSGLRSWRITGDYGSGKSSFALLLARLYSRRESELRPQVRAALAQPIHAIRRSGVHFQPILVSGSREPLCIALLRALALSLRDAQAPARRSRSQCAAEIEQMLAHPNKITDRSAIDILLKAKSEIARRDPRRGILIILDELGKFLEFAALHPERQDIFFLQQLAELAARTAGHEPLFVVGLLHQGFSAYAEMLSQSAQREWEKVAGRFEELLFDQPLEQISHLIAEALSIRTDRLPRGSDTASRNAMRAALRLRWYGSAAPANALQELAPRLYPLHPSTVPALVRFFRRWGQNERSLFSFLISTEPYGLREFCETKATADSYYRISHLYDYVATNFGHRLASQSYRSHWNHIDSLVRSFPSANATELEVLKTVAFLNLLDTPELAPTDDAISLAVGSDRSSSAVRATLERLHRDRHVLYSRGKQGGYCLWSHMSVNLDAAYEDASRAVGTGRRVMEWVKDHVQSRPIVARRHYIQTGTLRTFDVTYCDVRELKERAVAPPEDSDGRILLPLCETQEDVQTAEAVARTLKGYPGTLIGVPQPLASLDGLVREVEKWKWVERNTSALKDDRYAAEEVARQSKLAVQTLENRVDHYLGIRFAARRGDIPITWYHEGAKQKIRTSKAVMEIVSSICDDLYPKAPRIRNELINRKAISAAAALARTKLIERIFSNPADPMLGLDPSKKPPEMAMYLSVLRASNLHIESRSGWRLDLPRSDRDPSNTRPALLEIGRVLEDAGDRRIAVPTLFESLRAAPYGIRDGLLPLLLSVYMQINWHRTALYEDGTYLHDIGSREFVRLTKEPEHFELQHCAIEGVRAEVFAKLMETIGLDCAHKEHPDLLDVVRPLAIFAASLPDYSRRTKDLSATTVAVRNALMEAREPATLIFDTLPKACGFAPFSAKWSASKEARAKAAHAYADSLRASISELRGAYDRLVERLAAAVMETFEGEGTFEAARAELSKRAARVAPFVSDAVLKSFILRLADEALPRRQWLESLGSQLVRKPPERWVDQDEIEFSHQLAIHWQRFARVEAIAFQAGAASGSAYHLVMTRPDGTQVEHVFQWDEVRASVELEQDLAQLISRHGNRGLAVAAKLVWDALSTGENRKEAANG